VVTSQAVYSAIIGMILSSVRLSVTLHVHALWPNDNTAKVFAQVNKGTV